MVVGQQAAQFGHRALAPNTAALAGRRVATASLGSATMTVAWRSAAAATSACTTLGEAREALEHADAGDD